jgi:hypothetical protein
MKVALVVVVAGVGFLAPPSLAGAQGLGEAAKKEKQRRESGPAPGAKTYTQEDVAALPPVANEPSAEAGEPAPPEADPGRPGAPAAGASASADAEADARAREEERWRSRIAGQRQRVEDARQKHAALASLNLVPGYEYVDASGRTVIGSVAQLQGMTARAKAALEAEEQALEALLEQARRANVPPGWLR